MAKRSRSVVSTAAGLSLLLAAVPLLSIAGCGQKGPLVAAALMATPGAPDIVRRDGRLRVEELAVADLARRFGTPLYVYSSAAMTRALAPYQRALAGRDHLVCYAVKANSTLAVLQWFARQGCGF